jgi:hypothetical protein
MKTIEIPRRKFMVITCPKSAADAMPVNIVATVDEYFFKIVSAYLKKKDDKIPCAALFSIKNMVALECPCRMSKLPGPLYITVPSIPRKLNIAP